jgi:hypothetical protein
VTSLSGTMTLRGSVLPDVAGAEKLSHASKRVPTVTSDNAVRRPGRDPLPISPQFSHSVRSLRFHASEPEVRDRTGRAMCANFGHGT